MFSGLYSHQRNMCCKRPLCSINIKLALRPHPKETLKERWNDLAKDPPSSNLINFIKIL